MVEDVSAVVAVVEPVWRQSIWKAFEEHSTYGGQLSQRSAIRQRVSTSLVSKDQVHLTCISGTLHLTPGTPRLHISRRPRT